MVVKKSCVAACPVEWPDGRGISGRMRVEWVAGSAWNRWSDAHGMGGQMTVESALNQLIDDYRLKILPGKNLRKASLDHYQIRHQQIANGLGAMQLNMITLTQISDFLVGFSPLTSNLNRAILIDLFNHAVARGLLESNVAAKTFGRKHEKNRKRRFSR